MRTILARATERRRMLRADSNRGFTLVELLVVVVIIVAIAAVAVPMLLNQREKAVEGVLDSDAREVEGLLLNALSLEEPVTYSGNTVSSGGRSIVLGADGADVTGSFTSGDVPDSDACLTITVATESLTRTVCVPGATGGSGGFSVSYPSSSFSPGGNNQTLAPIVSGGTGPVTYTLDGTLPDGFTFDSGTGQITGPSTVEWENAIPSVDVSAGSLNIYFHEPHPDGGFVAVGDYFEDTIAAFGNAGTIEGNGSWGDWVGRLDADGNWLWVTTFGSDADGLESQAAVLDDGTVVVIGGAYTWDGSTSPNIEFNGQTVLDITGGYTGSIFAGYLDGDTGNPIDVDVLWQGVDNGAGAFLYPTDMGVSPSGDSVGVVVQFMMEGTGDIEIGSSLLSEAASWNESMVIGNIAPSSTPWATWVPQPGGLGVGAYANGLLFASNGDIIVNSSDAIARLNSSGVVWEEYFGARTQIAWIVPAGDGNGFIGFGHPGNPGNPPGNDHGQVSFVTKFDWNGDILWERTFTNGLPVGYITQGVPTPQGGIILSGDTDNGGNPDRVITRLSPSGIVEWTQTEPDSFGSIGMNYTIPSPSPGVFIFPINGSDYLSAGDVTRYHAIDGSGNSVIWGTPPGLPATVTVTATDGEGNEASTSVLLTVS